jgi:hypothetical protein
LARLRRLPVCVFGMPLQRFQRLLLRRLLWLLGLSRLLWLLGLLRRRLGLELQR